MLRDTDATRPRRGPRKGTPRRGFGRLRRERSGRHSAAYVGPDAQLHKAPQTFDSKDNAVAWLAAERRLIDLDVWTPPAGRVVAKARKGKTFGEFAEEWLPARRTRRGPLKPRTVADYRRLLDRHLLPTFRDMPLRRITEADVNAWYLSMSAGTPTERAHAYQLLRAILATAADPKVRLIPSNPCTIEGAGHVARAHKVEIASVEELSAIVEAMPDRLRLAVLLASWCALRYGEIAELRRKDVKLRSGHIVVDRGVTWPNGRPTVGTPKSDAGSRRVAIPPHLIPAVREHLEKHVDPSPEALLFPAAGGGHMHPRTFGKRFATAREAAGRPDLHFHDLRHTGGTMAAYAGATIAELMARLGHSTPGAAMRYQNVAKDRDKEIAAALSKMAEKGTS